MFLLRFVYIRITPAAAAMPQPTTYAAFPLYISPTGLPRALVRALPGAAARIPVRSPPAANPQPRHVRSSMSPLGSSTFDLISRDGQGGAGVWRGRASLKRMRGGGGRADWPLGSSSGVSSPVGGRDATEDVAGETEVGDSGPSSGGDSGGAVSKKKQNILKTLWEFSRPHTMVREIIEYDLVPA